MPRCCNGKGAMLWCSFGLLLALTSVYALATLMWPRNGSPRPAPPPSPDFDVRDARDTLYLAWAAFCNKSALQAWNCQWCNRTKGVELVRYLTGASMGTQGYVAVDRSQHRIIVAIRGSTNPRNYIEDGMFFTSHFLPSPGGARVHHGFLEAYRSIRGGILDAVNESRINCPECKVLVTGHSLGAAMATLAASALVAESGLTGVRLFTFGSPRVGNSAFAQWAKTLFGNNSVRMVRENDLVPSIPPMAIGYRHLPTEIWDRHRQGDEDWYVRCDASGEDPRCSDSEWSLSTDQHTRYMGFKGGYCRGASPDEAAAELVATQVRVELI